MSWQFDRNKPQYFHQKGWIATQFKVKNNLAALLRLRQRNNTELARGDHKGTIHHMSTELKRDSKPATAPEKMRRNAELLETEQFQPMSAVCQDPMPGFVQSKYSNFKTTLNNRRQLLFLKPYTRNKNTSLTIDQRKTEIYQQINNPDLDSFNIIQCGPIEYLTQYSEPNTTRGSKDTSSKPKNRPISQHRTSLNVLREKLKKRCEMSFYQTKINRLNQP